MQFNSEITREEYSQLLSSMTANINDQFELWLTNTFAASSAQSIIGKPSFQFGLTAQDAGVATVISILRILVWFGGTIVALAFVLRGFGQNDV